VWDLESRGAGTLAFLQKLVSALDLRFAGLPRGTSLSDQAKTLRKRRSWTQQELAAAAGVSTPAIIRLESGNARISTLSAVLTVLAPGARVRKPDVSNWGGASRDEKFTPPDVFDRIVKITGPITLDPCGHPDSAVRAECIFYAAEDGLQQPWSGSVVFVNPPYSLTATFVAKSHRSWREGVCKTVLLLLPVQTHHRWFHREVVGSADVFFLNGKIAYDRPGLPRSVAPFGNMIVMYGADAGMIQRTLEQFDCVHLPRNAAVGCRDGSSRSEPACRSAAE
jgi:transcriptional regulator with XRE-family HTH domain